jgi:acetyl esterase/lipase
VVGPKYGAGNLDPMASDLAGRGWLAWNVEYRRLGLGGGFPATLQDAADAIDYLTALGDAGTGPVVAIGHSAGGHLAAWAAGRGRLAPGAPGAGPLVELSGVVSLAGILDLSAAARDRIGNGAATRLVGGSPEEYPGRYLVADPLAQVPIPATVYCVHAQADDRVPFTQAVTYVDAALAAGQHAKLLQVEGDHFSIADPGAPTWPSVITALEAMTAAS